MGIISSFYLQSDDLDEIDVVEIFGSDPYEFQTNFFIKGNVSNYDRGKYHQMHPSPLSGFHKYGLEWTPDLITWFLDDKPVRMLGRKNRHGMPCSPMFLKFSLWSADENDEGTIAWAGGVASFSEAPFSMHVKNLHIQDYSTGLSYNYGRLRNGKWLDLSSEGGKIYEGHRFCTPPDGLVPQPKKKSSIVPTTSITQNEPVGSTSQCFTEPTTEWEDNAEEAKENKGPDGMGRAEEKEGTKEAENKEPNPKDKQENDEEYVYDKDQSVEHEDGAGKEVTDRDADAQGVAEKENGIGKEDLNEVEKIFYPVQTVNHSEQPLRVESTKEEDELQVTEDMGKATDSESSKKKKKSKKTKTKTNTEFRTKQLDQETIFNSSSTVMESITSTSTSRARVPYNIFFQYPERENSLIRSGVSRQVSASILGIVFAEALIVMTLLL